MKNPLLVAIFLPLALAGCATNTYERGDAAAKSLQNAGAEVQLEGRQLSFTMSSLENLVNRPAVDLRPQFKQFTANLDRLELCARRNEKAAEQAAIRNAVYLVKWDREITNMNYEIVKSRSEARRAEVVDNITAVSRRYAEARNVMQPLLAYLNDIRHALDADLTVAGLNSVKPIVINAAENAHKVRIALGTLSGELAKSGARMSPVAYESPATPPTVSAR